MPITLTVFSCNWVCTSSQCTPCARSQWHCRQSSHFLEMSQEIGPAIDICSLWNLILAQNLEVAVAVIVKLAGTAYLQSSAKTEGGDKVDSGDAPGPGHRLGETKCFRIHFVIFAAPRWQWARPLSPLLGSGTGSQTSHLFLSCYVLFAFFCVTLVWSLFPPLTFACQGKRGWKVKGGCLLLDAFSLGSKLDNVSSHWQYVDVIECAQVHSVLNVHVHSDIVDKVRIFFKWVKKLGPQQTYLYFESWS
jgi:hypothetical protein